MYRDSPPLGVRGDENDFEINLMPLTFKITP
jgi:hypothetical protein